jgi:formate dehydrogenase subunit gamma
MLMTGFEEWSLARGAAIIADAAKQDGACIPILHALQRAFGYVPQEAVPMVAQALNLTRAEVYGVVTFYHDFRREPPGRHVMKLCRAEACQSMGAVALHHHAQDKLRIGWGETTTDGRVTLEPVYCLGLCACAPAAMVDGKVYGGLDPAKLGTLIDQVRTA